jgi:DNA-binding CsgD family transcriptional regulator
MHAWLGRSLAEQGRYADADVELARVLRQPHLSPVTQIAAAVVAGQLAVRRGQDDPGHLAAVLAGAESTGEIQRLAPLAAARAAAAWIAGRVSDIPAEIDRAWSAALAHPHPWALGELSWWLVVGGARRPTPLPVPRPFALMLAEEWTAAAEEWGSLGCPLWTAIALAWSPELTDGRRALEIVEEIGAPAVGRAMLRDRHARGQPVPRGRRAPGRANAAHLTARELEVLGLLVEGLSNAELAQRLYLSEKTVGHHVSAVLHKMGEPSRARAVAAARRRRIVPPI